jgi:homoserine O-acetyltransferase
MNTGRVGRVHTQRVVLFTEDDPLVLDSGATLFPVEVAYETYGRLAADATNAVVVCPALTGDAHAAGDCGEPGRRGWWDSMIGPGHPIDTERFFVVCADLLGGCRGTTGPSSADPATGRPYGLRFPLLTVRDLVAVHRALVAQLGIRRVHAVLGGSLGGMQALQWALDHPGEVQRAVLICASARLSAQNIAFSAVARSAITHDPDFQAWEYHGTGRAPALGLAVARMMAHITYLSEAGMQLKFGRQRSVAGSGTLEMTLDADFEVERYLHHQGEIFLERFDALTYLYLTRSMDYFDPFAAEALDLTRVTTRMRAISFDSDWRFGSEHSRHIVQVLGEGGVEIDHVEINSPWGHDSFLLELPDYHGAVAEALAVRAGVLTSNQHFSAQPAPASLATPMREMHRLPRIGS